MVEIPWHYKWYCIIFQLQNNPILYWYVREQEPLKWNLNTYNSFINLTAAYSLYKSLFLYENNKFNNLQIKLILNEFSGGFVKFVLVAIHPTFARWSSLCSDLISRILVILGIRFWSMFNTGTAENVSFALFIIFDNLLESLHHFNLGFGTPDIRKVSIF